MSSRLLFLGSKRIGLRCLQSLAAVVPEALVGAVTIDDRADGIGRTAFDELAAFCRQGNVPLTVALTRAQAAAAVDAHRPDICVVCGWYWLVDRAQLVSVPQGFIGLHLSPLPKYRGGSPLVWQIINGEPEVGVSLFSFSEGMDEGPIWEQRRVRLDPDESIGDVLPRLEDVALEMIEATVPRIMTREADARPQHAVDATYCAQRHPRDGLIDWSAQARVVHNFIRAQSHPYPGAFTFADARKVTVWKARVVDTTYYGNPGQVVRVGRDGVWVVCGDHRPIVIERAGLDGSDLAAGEVLGSTALRLSESHRAP